MDYISAEYIDFIFPFRISILGAINSGKSTFLFAILNNLEVLCHTEAFNDNIKILLLSRNVESIKTISNICLKKNYQFERWATLQSLDRLISNETNENIIFILEDFQDVVNGLR